MPQSVYRVTTDKGTFNVTVEDDQSPTVPVNGKPPDAATSGMMPQSTTSSPAEAYFEDLPGAQGQRFHPPAGSGDELHRPDNSVLGMPPELAAVGAAGIANGAVQAGLKGASRAVGATKEALGQATPLVAYHATKGTLEAVGIPSPWATAAADAVAVMAGRGRPRARSVRVKAPVATPVASPVVAVVTEAPVVAEAVAAAPAAAEAAAAVPVPHPAGSVWSPQRIQNELGLAARRAGTKLTEPQYQEAAELVTKGASPLEAVKSIAGGTTAVPRARISGAEVKEYLRLRGMGKSDAEAKSALEAVKALAAKMGGPTTAAVKAAVKERNATGRWQ